MGSNLKQQAVSGVIWTFAQQFSVQVINFIVQILLARLLAPEMFGLIAMLTLFISIGQSLMDGGMTNSLIRTKRPDQLDYSTVFVTNTLVSVGIYIITFLIAPLVANFYNQPVLKDILRVFSLSFVIRSLVAVHVAKLTKEMNFKTQMRLQVPSTVIGAMVGVVMAYLGYGVWSLVWLNLAQVIIFTIQIWSFIDWRPSLVFNKRRFKYHFNFGYKMTLSSLLDTIYNDAYKIVIGKLFLPATVGYYNQAETMRLFPVLQLSSVVGKVTYPLFSNLSNDIQLKSAYKGTLKLLCFITVPLMMILIIGAQELFLTLFGEKWLPAVPYFQILAFASIVRPLGVYNLNILKVKGRSDLFLKIEVIKKAIGFLAILIAVPFGINALIVSATLVAYISTLINMLYSGRIINYFLLEQVKDIIVIFVVGLFCLVVCYYLRMNLVGTLTPLPLLIVVSFVYAGLYLFLIYLFDRDPIHVLRKLLKNRL